MVFTHDADGRLLTETLPGSVSRSWTWDDGRPDTYTEARPEGTRTTTLGHDLADRIVSETTGGVTTTFDHDPAGQLTTVTRGSETTTIDYDDAGNRISRTTGNRRTVYAHDAAHQLTSATRKVAGTAVETLSFAHDGAGRMTSMTGTARSRTLAYDFKGVLASVTTTTASGLGSLATVTSRTTDGDGTLVSATTTAPLASTTTGLTWDPSPAVPEVATTSTGGADTDHLYGFGRALALRSGQSDTYAQDAFGSTLAIGEASDLARAEGYDEFGVPQADLPSTLMDEVAGLDASGGDAVPTFGYRGETTLDGLVHLRAREYFPGLDRFTTVDPLDGVPGETTVGNPYPYGWNDPLDLVDPLGLRPLSDADLRQQPCPAGTTWGTSTISTYDYLAGRDSGTTNFCAGSTPFPWRVVADAFGFVPVVGDFVDGGLCIGSTVTGNFGDAALDCIAIIPVAGSLGKGAKYGDEAVDLTTPARRKHILEGDATAGGHLWPGKPGKTPFPRGWSADRIIHEISDVATDPTSTRLPGRGGTTIVRGTRDGINIEVVMRNGEIVTGYPTNLPRNPQ